MAVTIGSARIDERGKAKGGAAGDQTGKEVSTQSWYLHKKGWRVFRCTVAAKAKLIAAAMKAACANSRIGYDQGQRLTLYNEAAKVGFDPAKVTVKVETDCSGLVRVCVRYAGISVGNFTTATEARMLLNTGMFTELTGDKYTKKSDYLKAGDVLVTKTSGHTVVVLTNGSKAAKDTTKPAAAPALGERLLINGMGGADVKELQTDLIALGYSCGSWGADGDFGDATELAVRKFQKDHPPLEADGEYGPLTHAAMLKALAAAELPADPRVVRITGGNCFVRTAPVVNDTNKLGVAHEGDELEYQGVTDENGWHLVAYAPPPTRSGSAAAPGGSPGSQPGLVAPAEGSGATAIKQNAWVSGKYGRVM